MVLNTSATTKEFSYTCSCSAHDRNDEEEDPDALYVVDMIINHRTIRGEIQFKVHWQHYPPSYDSWEPRDSLESITLLREYEEQMGLDPPAGGYPANDDALVNVTISGADAAEMSAVKIIWKMMVRDVKSVFCAISDPKVGEKIKLKAESVLVKFESTHSPKKFDLSLAYNGHLPPSTRFLVESKFRSKSFVNDTLLIRNGFVKLASKLDSTLKFESATVASEATHCSACRDIVHLSVDEDVVECKQCQIAVHPSCYDGVADQFICFYCRSGKMEPLQCELCLQRTPGPFRPLAGPPGRYVHAWCEMMSPLCRVSEETDGKEEPTGEGGSKAVVGVPDAITRNSHNKCSVCNLTGGAPLRCSVEADAKHMAGESTKGRAAACGLCVHAECAMAPDSGWRVGSVRVQTREWGKAIIPHILCPNHRSRPMPAKDRLVRFRELYALKLRSLCEVDVQNGSSQSREMLKTLECDNDGTESDGSETVSDDDMEASEAPCCFCGKVVSAGSLGGTVPRLRVDPCGMERVRHGRETNGPGRAPSDF
eukprot:436726_1